MRSATSIAEAALTNSSPTRAPRRRRSGAGAMARSVGDLAQRIVDIEAKLSASAGALPASELTDEALATVAQRIYKARRRRARHLPVELLGEPAWDMLLDLFVATVRGKRVRTTSACLAARSPGSTGLRWLAALEAHGLVERHGEPGDRRVKLIRLTRQGYQLMRRYLVEGIDATELPAGWFVP